MPTLGRLALASVVAWLLMVAFVGFACLFAIYSKPAYSMSRAQCKALHQGHCHWHRINGRRIWEPGRIHIAVPVPVRRLHAILHDPDVSRWDNIPRPQFADRFDAAYDRNVKAPEAIDLSWIGGSGMVRMAELGAFVVRR